MDDIRLIETIRKAQKGDTEAIGALFNEYKHQLYFYLKNYITEENDIEDVLQETFISIFKSIDKLETPLAYKGWVYKIAYRRAMDFHRKNKSSEMLLPEEATDLFENIEDVTAEFIPGQILETDETRNYVVGLVKELTEEQKTAVLLYYYKQMSVAQIAELMECAEGTIKSRLNYARKYIKSKIEEKQKKGHKVIAVVPIPILTQILLWQAEQTKLSAEANNALWNGIEIGLGLTTAVEGSIGTAAATTGTKIAGVTVTAKAVAIVVGLVVTAAAVVGVVMSKAGNIENVAVPIEQQGEQIINSEGVSSGTIIEQEPASSEDDISLLFNPQTKSEYAQLYYRFTQDYLLDDAPNKIIEHRHAEHFTDAEMVDFDLDGEYELVVMFNTEKGVVNPSEAMYVKVFFKDEVIDIYEQGEYIMRNFIAQIVQTCSYLAMYEGRPAFFEEVYNRVYIHTFSKESGAERAFLEDKTTYQERKNVLSTWGAIKEYAGTGYNDLDFDLMIEKTQGERLRDYFDE